MFEMDDEVAFVELAEIDLSAIAAELFGALQPPPAVGGVTPEQFRAGKDTSCPSGKTKPRGERSFHQLDARNGVSHDFAEPLDFAFRLEINDDAKSAARQSRNRAANWARFASTSMKSPTAKSPMSQSVEMRRGNLPVRFLRASLR